MGATIRCVRAAALPVDDGVAGPRRLAAPRPGGPEVLADTQVTPGAGGESISTGLLRALVAADVRNAAPGLLADPAAATRAYDLRGATRICDDVVVMQHRDVHGDVVEYRTASKGPGDPQHDDTRAVIPAAPCRAWDFANFRPLRKTT